MHSHRAIAKEFLMFAVSQCGSYTGFIKNLLQAMLHLMSSKKVLLRERKRHTARRVASALCTALSRGRGVVAPSILIRVVTPIQPDGVHQGTSLLGWMGYPHQARRWLPPPPPPVNRQAPVKTVLFPFLRNARSNYIWPKR